MCLRRAIYRAFSTLVYRAEVQIISVGNLIAGGAGKTPFVLYLASEMLKNRKTVGIVLRGYRSGRENENLLVNAENIHTVGDEAAQYAHKLPKALICIGKDRQKSIKMLCKSHPDLDCIIMDDGFQHLSVHADTHYCIFNSLNPIGNGFCLPAGLLREPLSALKYADFVVINGENIPPEIYTRLLSFQKPIIQCQYTLSAIRNLQGNEIDIGSFTGKQILLLSGIGLPQSFEHTVTQAGLTFSEHMMMGDHFRYTNEWFDKYNDKFRLFDCILTTEKDITKILRLKVELEIFYVEIEIRS